MFPSSVSVFRLISRGLSNASRRWRVNMLYDSQCPLCMHEVRFLERRNTAGLVKFTDIASPDYNPADNGEVDYERGMKVIHAVLESGEVVEGVAVFRHVYTALGLGWVWAITRLPGISWAADRVYSVWAKQRMRITGREELEVIFSKRRQNLSQKGKLCGDSHSQCQVRQDNS